MVQIHNEMKSKVAVTFILHIIKLSHKRFYFVTL